MKKILKFLPLLLLAVVGLAFTACGDDDDENNISPTELPATAKAFVSTYFPSAKIVSVNKDHDEYEVILSDGTTIDFDRNGEWEDVDAAIGKTVPTGYYPAAIDTYVAEHHAGTGINEISRERGGYEVELTDGLDIHFDTNGTFLRYDRN